MSNLNIENLSSILDKISSFKSAIFLVLTGITRLNYHDNDKQKISVNIKTNKHNKTNNTL